MASLDKKFTQVASRLLMYEELAYLVNDLEKHYRNCISEIVNNDNKKFWDNYATMDEMYSLLLYLNKECEIPRKTTIKEIRKKMFYIQGAKRNWDELMSATE